MSPPIEVGVVLFEFRGRHDAARQNAIAKSGRETLDLVLDARSVMSTCDPFGTWQ